MVVVTSDLLVTKALSTPELCVMLCVWFCFTIFPEKVVKCITQSFTPHWAVFPPLSDLHLLLPHLTS